MKKVLWKNLFFPKKNEIEKLNKKDKKMLKTKIKAMLNLFDFLDKLPWIIDNIFNVVLIIFEDMDKTKMFVLFTFGFVFTAIVLTIFEKIKDNLLTIKKWLK